jgi:glycosyltransferase involved in cell wall biosynthesis
MKEMLVSVVIPVYNGEDYIKETLESIFEQTYKTIEVIIVDDGSTDDSEKVIAEYDDRVTYIKQSNAGPAAARNNGVRHATGEYVAFLDADDIWMPEKLSRQISIMQDNDAGFSHTGSLVFDEQKEFDYRPKSQPEVMSAQEAFDTLFFSNFITTSTVVVNRIVLSEAGFFDEDPGLFAVEDYDLWLRVVQRTNVSCIDEPLLKYRFHADGISKNIDRSYQHEKNVIDKWYKNDPEALSQLSFSKNKRYEKLMMDWGDCHMWRGSSKEAKSLYFKSLKEFGMSKVAAKKTLKASIKSLLK